MRYSAFIWIILFLLTFISVNSNSAQLATQSRINIPFQAVPNSSAELRLEKVYVDSGSDEKEARNPHQFFSVELPESSQQPFFLKSSFSIVSQIPSSHFYSVRNIRKMKPGYSYTAQYGLYQGGEKVDSYFDIVRRAFALSGKKGNAFSRTRVLINDHEAHTFLLAVAPGMQSLEVKVETPSTDDLAIRLLDSEGRAMNLLHNNVQGHDLENKELSFQLPTLKKRQIYELTIQVDSEEDDHEEFNYSIHAQARTNHDDPEIFEQFFTLANPVSYSLLDFFGKTTKCRKASKKQKAPVDQGNKRMYTFLQECNKVMKGHLYKTFCDQVIRPNPASRAIFHCTYGKDQPHQLIHPDRKTWKHAFNAIQLLQEMSAMGIETCEIRNWWRPEPYNKNVSGSPTRHPFGVSVDVHFCTKTDQINAFKQLCRFRKQGRIRAIGFYSSNVLHLGMGDKRANTWGRSCGNIGAPPKPKPTPKPKPPRKPGDQPSQDDDSFQRNDNKNKNNKDDDSFQRNDNSDSGSDSFQDNKKKKKKKKENDSFQENN